MMMLKDSLTHLTMSIKDRILEFIRDKQHGRYK